MVKEYKVEKEGNEYRVKAHVRKEGNNVIVSVPSFPLIKKLIKEQKEKDGERNLQ